MSNICLYHVLYAHYYSFKFAIKSAVSLKLAQGLE
jgi:hypothetical protein